MKIEYIDRSTGELKEENVVGKKSLEFIYSNFLGKIILEALIKRKFASVLYGKYQDTKRSSRKIPGFIKDQNIDMDEFIESDYRKYETFNDFFYRKIKPSKRPFTEEKAQLSSPCDSRALFYNSVDRDFKFPVKGFELNMSNLIMDSELEKKFSGGAMAVFRLCPSDYHRFHFIDDGKVKCERLIDGDYYSVNPIALNIVKDLFSKNKRNLTLLETESFGDILYIEVGATFVGSIVQTYDSQKPVKKGGEKGYFKFGGSTVVLLFEKDRIEFDSDIIRNSNQGIETYVKAGEKIGDAVKTSQSEF